MLAGTCAYPASVLLCGCAGKVVDRHWYNKIKHIFPASRWEVYEPEKEFDSYTIYG